MRLRCILGIDPRAVGESRAAHRAVSEDGKTMDSSAPKVSIIISALDEGIDYLDQHPELEEPADRGRTFVLAGDEDARVALIKAGFEPGLVVSQADLTRKYQL